MNLFNSVNSSVFGLCADFAAAMATKFPDDPGLSVYNFDAFSEQPGLPSGDLVGVHGFTLDTSGKLATFKALFGIATDNDENLFRLNRLTGELFQLLLPDTRHSVWDADQSTRVEIGKWVVMDGTSASPLFSAMLRPVKLISVRGAITIAAQ